VRTTVRFPVCTRALAMSFDGKTECTDVPQPHPHDAHAGTDQDPVQSVRDESMQWFAQYKSHKGLPAARDIQDPHVSASVLAWEKALLSCIVQLRCVDRVGSFLDGVPAGMQHTVQDSDRHALLAWHKEKLTVLQKDLHMYTSCLTGYMATVQNVETLVQQRLDMLNAMDRHTAFTRVVPQLAQDFAKRTALMTAQAHKNKHATLQIARERLLRHAPSVSARDDMHDARSQQSNQTSDTDHDHDSTSSLSSVSSFGQRASTRRTSKREHQAHTHIKPSHEQQRVSTAARQKQVHAESYAARQPRAARPKPQIVMVDDNTTFVSDAVPRRPHSQQPQITHGVRAQTTAPEMTSISRVSRGASLDASTRATGVTAAQSVHTRSTLPRSNQTPSLPRSPNTQFTTREAVASGDGSGTDATYTRSAGYSRHSERDSKRSDAEYNSEEDEQSGSDDDSARSSASDSDGSTDAYTSNDSVDTRTEDAVTRAYSSDEDDGEVVVVQSIPAQSEFTFVNSLDAVAVKADQDDAVHSVSPITPVEVFVGVKDSGAFNDTAVSDTGNTPAFK